MMHNGAKRADLDRATGNADGKLHIENLAVLQE